MSETNTPKPAKKTIGKEPTPEVVRHRRRRAILGVWGGLLLAWLLSNAVLAYALRQTPLNRGDWLIRSKWQVADDLAEPPRWLVLGDSSGNQGVDPAVMGGELGGQAVNLCMLGSIGTVGDALMLDRVIDRVGPPEHLVIVHVYDVWGRGDPNLGALPVPIDAAFDPDSPMPLDWDAKLSVLFSRAMPTAGQPQSFRRLIKDPMVLTRDTDHFRLTDAGFMPMNRPRPRAVREDVDRHRAMCAASPTVMTDTSRRVLDRVAALADEHGFDVYLVNAPMYRGAYADPVIRAHYEQVNAELSEWAAMDDRLHHLLAEPALYDAEQMENADHVVGDAAADYTRRVCEAIRAIND